jgi:hypothetical protein
MTELCPSCAREEMSDRKTGFCGRCASAWTTMTYESKKRAERVDRWRQWTRGQGEVKS